MRGPIDWDAGRSDRGWESVLTSLAPEAARQPGTRPLMRPSLRTIGWATSPHHKGGATTMGTVTGQSVGIDISEDFLDVYLHPAGKGYAVSVVNPERIRAYRRLVGRVAKTDRIDARLIAEYGATMR